MHGCFGVQMNRDVAEEINKLMLEYGAKLDASVRLVMESGSEAEFEAYRAAVGQIMGTMLLDVMNPIYREHPDLKPAELE
jgi:hypothetical protein